MNKTAIAFPIALLLAGCMSLPLLEWQAGLYAFLDPNTGVTYKLRLRCSLSTPCAADAEAAGQLAAGSDEPRLQADKRLLDTLTGAPVIAAAVPARRVAPPDTALPPLRLKLDTEFASAQRSITVALR